MPSMPTMPRMSDRVVYRNTLSSLRISAVDGTAFLDACATLVPYADGNHLVEIYDSAGRMLRGFLKAQGGGETVGSELITAWANDNPPWNTFTPNANGHDLDAAINTSGTAQYGKSNAVGTVGSKILLKTAATLTLNSGAAPQWGDGGYGQFPGVTLIHGSPVTTYYTLASATANSNYLYINSVSPHTTNFSAACSASQVTAPSTDGATIVNAKGGTTYNFAYKNASFAYNAASYYVIVKKVR